MQKVPHVIVSNDLLQAWEEAYRHVYHSGRKRFNLVVHINDARTSLVADGDVYDLDPAAIAAGTDHVFDVANTLFPARSDKWDLSVEDFSEHYKEAYRRLLGRGRRSWGCYFLRLVDFGNEINQLHRIHHALTTWGVRAKSAYVVHFSSAHTERPRKLGAPCLQYVQFGYDSESRLCLTALYRAHDYFSKALGNYIGLSRMLEYLADKAGVSVGSITCYSSYAFIDKPLPLARQLLRERSSDGG